MLILGKNLFNFVPPPEHSKTRITIMFTQLSKVIVEKANLLSLLLRKKKLLLTHLSMFAFMKAEHHNNSHGPLKKPHKCFVINIWQCYQKTAIIQLHTLYVRTSFRDPIAPIHDMLTNTPITKLTVRIMSFRKGIK